MGSTVCSECTVLCMFVPPYQISISIPVLIKLHADIFCHGKVPEPYTLYFHTLLQLPLHICCVIFISNGQFNCISLFGGLLNLIKISILIPVNMQENGCGIVEMSSLICWQNSDKCACMLVCVCVCKRTKKCVVTYAFCNRLQN